MIERFRSVRPFALVGILSVVISVIYTVMLAYFAFTHSSLEICGDDSAQFWKAKVTPLKDYLFAPVDVHRVPLFQLATYVLLRVAPYRYGPAEAVLLVFHVAGCVFLYKALREIRRTPMNGVLIAWYAATPYLGSVLYWWTAGAVRVGYVLFWNAATYYYLKYRAQPTRTSFGLVVACTVLSMGFFAKSVLIVGYLAGIEIALRCVEGERLGGERATAPRRSYVWPLLAVVGILCFAYVIIWRAVTDPSLREANWDPGFMWVWIKWSWVVVALETAGFLIGSGTEVAVWIAAAWALIFVYSFMRVRASLVAWGVAAALTTVSIYMTTSSARAHAVGLLGAVSADRYYFDLCSPLVLFTGVALAGFEPGRIERAVLRRPLLAWSGAIGAVLLVLCLATNSYRSATRLFETQYREHSRSKQFLDNVRSGLVRVTRDANGAWPFVDGFIPADFIRFMPNPKKKSQLLELMGERPRLVEPQTGAYWITESGRVFRL